MDYRSWPSKIGACNQRMQVRSNNCAEKVRIRFSNRYGLEPLLLDAAVLRIRDKEYPLTCSGRTQINLLPDKECCSDEIYVRVLPGECLEIIFFMRAETVLTGGTVTYSRRELEVTHTDAGSGILMPQEEVFSMVKDNPRMCFLFGISGIDFYCREQEKLVTAFGDSLTQQGFWVDHLKRRLRKYGKEHIAVNNRGIGGSRILKGTSPFVDSYDRHGVSGIERFEKDCFGMGKPDLIILFHGINDLITRHTYPTDYSFTLDEIKAGLQFYAEISHRYDTDIWIATLTPLKNSIFYSEELEAERRILNNWIRKRSSYDRVMEFEQAVCSEQDNKVLDAAYDSGDGLHFSDEGGRAIANSIDFDNFL